MKYIASIFFIAAFAFVPVLTLAQGPDGDLTGTAAPGQNQIDRGLVPCEGVNCNACHAVALANNIITFLFQLLSVFAVIMLVISGFRLVTSGGDTEAATKSKKMFTNVVIGFLIVLASWLIVDTIMKTLVDEGNLKDFGPWNELRCA